MLVLQSTPHYLSHTKTDGPIGGIANYKTTRIRPRGGRLQFDLKLSEIEQTRRPGKLVIIGFNWKKFTC